VFGSGFGLEHVNYFAPAGEEPFETPTFRRSNAFAAVGEECRAVRTAVGINEIHNFGKYQVTGAGAASWLGRLMAGRVPAPGRMTLTPMLSPGGRLIGDFTITCLGKQRYQLTASYAAQSFHMRWFEAHLPKSGVTIRNMSLRRIGFQIAGPRARDLLSRVTTSDVGNAALPFLSAREMDVGLVPAIVCRVTYTGDLGYEIYVAPRYQLALYEALHEAGQDLGLRPFGMRAMMSLRLEKSFGAWLREYRPDYSAAETGLDRFVDFTRNDFIGRDAAAAERDNPPARKLCTFVVEAEDADVWADEPIWKDDEVVGFVTSGGYAHFVDQSVALGLVPRALAEKDAAFEIEILGNRRPARLITEALLDPEGARMRA